MTGEAALVLGGGEGLGRAVALALGARGVRVMVAGGEERALARVVGEVTCGGGTARHTAGEATTTSGLEMVLGRVLEGWGKLSWLVVADPTVGGEAILAAASPLLTYRGARMLFVGITEIAGRVACMMSEPKACAGTCNGILWRGDVEADLDRVGDVAAFLCSDAADGITGQTLVVSM